MTWTTLPMAKKQVGIPATDCANDDLLQQFLTIAEAICVNYAQGLGLTITMTAQQISSLTVEQTAIIRGAMYLQFAELWRYRGDDPDGLVPEGSIPGAPSMQVQRCLLPLRVPSIA